jgi:hypothetical protein
MLKLVPFNPNWIKHDKVDLHAIYLRPARAEDRYGDLVQRKSAGGELLWDTTTPLPVKQHHLWETKGYRYLTLARREDLIIAAKYGTLQGGTVSDYAQDPRTGGPWNLTKYQDGQAQTASDGLEQLRADVTRFGSEAVQAIRASMDPSFMLPPDLQGIPAAARAEAVAEGEPVKRVRREKVAVN